MRTPENTAIILGRWYSYYWRISQSSQPSPSTNARTIPWMFVLLGGIGIHSTHPCPLSEMIEGTGTSPGPP
jgi:hypothetical protein